MNSYKIQFVKTVSFFSIRIVDITIKIRYNIFIFIKGGHVPWGSKAIVKAFRSRNIGANGMVVSIDMDNLDTDDYEFVPQN